MTKKFVKIKRRAQRVHFRKRAKERLGFEPTDAEIENMRQTVQRGKAEFLAKNSLRVSIWRVFLIGRPVVVLYDLETDELVTILTETMWQSRVMTNSPHVNDKADLKGSLEEHPAAKELRKMLEKMGGH